MKGFERGFLLLVLVALALFLWHWAAGIPASLRAEFP